MAGRSIRSVSGDAETRRSLGAALRDGAPARLRRRPGADFGRPPRQVCNPFITNRKKRRGAQKNACVLRRFAQITESPNTHVPVVVCRSAGIWTRGQSTAPRKDRQPEANRRTPPNGGRDLKQRRTGLFRLCRPLQRSAYRRGLSILPGVRKGLSPPNDGCEFRRRGSPATETWLRRSI